MNRSGFPSLMAGVIIFILLAPHSAAGDAFRVITHDRELVVTDPSTGTKSHERWGLFPGRDMQVRQITMYVRFACPDTMRCADWDYSDRIMIQRTGGVDGESRNWEIGRIITPYGGAFPSDWDFTWQTDVTDFSMVLRDSVEINFIHSGYEPNHDRGWSVTVEFDIIVGIPMAVPVSVTEIYNDHFSYGDPDRAIEDHLLSVRFETAPGAEFALLRVIQTGHGMDKPDNCAEFCSKYREFWYDGDLIERRQMWMECGDNPVFPQAGTWIFDRGNWCPGYLMQPETFILPVLQGSTHTVHFVMEPYTATVQNNGTQVISAYLVQYGNPAEEHDATVVDVMVPTDKQIYSRMNPSGANPRIVIRNNGSENLRSLTINYGTAGFGQKMWQWEGNLAFGQTDTVALPGMIDGRRGTNEFTVELVGPNGKQDGYAADNTMATAFTGAPRHSGELVFYLHTNREPWQTAWYLTNSEGDTIGQRICDSLAVETAFLDTLSLEPGAYCLSLVDTGGDGLEFWYNVQGGRGEARLMDGSGSILKAFESDFGSGWAYGFFVDEEPDPVDPNAKAISLHPTRTNEWTRLRYVANTAGDVTVRLVADPGGDVLEEHRYFDLKEGSFTYDLGHHPAGRFYLKVFLDDTEVFSRRVRHGE